MIKVECVACKSPYDVDERRIPDKGMKMRCPKCNTSFMVGKSGLTGKLPASPKATKPSANKPIAPPIAPPIAAGPAVAPPKTPVPEQPLPARRPAAANTNSGSASTTQPTAASVFKRTLLGAGTPPTAAADSEAMPGFGIVRKSHEQPDALADLPAVKPAPKPAVPWGSLAPPSPDAKPAPRSVPAALPKGAMGTPSNPPLAAAAAIASSRSSVGSAFGAAAKRTLLGPARAPAPQHAAGEAARLEAAPGAAQDLADLPAPKPSAKLAPDFPVVDLPAAKPPPAAAGRAPAKPAAAAPEPPLVDLPAAKPAAQVSPFADLPAPKPAKRPIAPAFAPPAQPPHAPAEVDLPAPKPADRAAPPWAAHGGPPHAPAEVDLPAPKPARAKGPIAPAFNPQRPQAHAPEIDLPAPKPTHKAAPPWAAHAAGEPGVIDLPSPKQSNAHATMHAGFGQSPAKVRTDDPTEPLAHDELDLSAPTDFADLPAPKDAFGATTDLLDLPMPKETVDLPAPTGVADLPAPRGIVDLPAPRGIADLPAPRGIVDLPAPKDIADLPTPAGLTDLPSRKLDPAFGELDLPVPKPAIEDEANFGDLELPELPVRAGFGDIELPVPRAGADVAPPKAATYRGVGPHVAHEEASFGDLNLDGPPADLDYDEASFGDIRPDDLVALKSDPSGLDIASIPPALRQDQQDEADYGEAGLLDDDADEDMEFGIAPQDGDEGFALPPEILRRQRGEAAAEADTARGKRALRWVLGVAAGVLLVGGAGAALGLTNYGYFGIYFLERYLPEAGDARFAHEAIARAEKTAVSDTYHDVRRSLSLLGAARHKAGLNRELLTRSLLHESLALVRFGPDANSAAHAAAMLSRLEERHGLAPGMDLARAADAARRQAYADAEGYLVKARAQAQHDPYVGLVAGEVALRQGKLAEAQKAFAQALKDGGGARAQWGLARLSLARSDQAAAKTAIDETLKLSPAHTEAHLAHARVLWAQGKEDEAMRELHATLGLSPSDSPFAAPSKLARAQGFSMLGFVHESRGRLQPARKAYEAALSDDPYLVEALLGAGRVLLREHRYNDALARFESGLGLAKKSGNAALLTGRRADVEAHLGQGRALLALDRAPEAKASLASLMKDNPNDADIVLAMGQVEDALGDKRTAEDLLKKSIELAPQRFATYLALSQHYFKTDQPDKASETLNEAATKVEENVEMRRMLGQSELARNRFDSAVHEFKRAVELDPHDPEAQFGLAVAYRKSGELDQAAALFDQIAQRDPQFAGLTVERGQLLEAQGDYIKAVDSYREAHEKDPTDSSVTLRLGAAQVEAGLLDDAELTLQTVMREMPNSAEAEYFTGRLALARGRGPDALTHFDRALSLDTTQAIYHLYAGRAALEMGNLGRALSEAEAALDRDASLGDAYWIRGVVRMRSGAVIDAQKDARRALALKPSRIDAYALIAECYDELRQLPQAAEAYHTALSHDSSRGYWWYKLGRLDLDMGARSAANDDLSKATDIGDKQEPMPYWLPDVYRLRGELARSSNDRRRAVALFTRYLKIAPDGALDRDEVRKLLRSWGVELDD